MPCLFFFLLLPVLCLTGLHAQEVKDDSAKPFADVRQRIKKISASEYDLDGIHINAATREVRIPTQVQLKQAPLEYMLVHETGKTHESVLTTAVSPTAIQLALLLANYQAASEGILKKVPADQLPPTWKEDAPAKAGANQLKIQVEWKVGDETKKAALSEWVQNIETRKPPTDLDTWIFNGSYTDERGFIGEYEGSIISVWLDRGALINSPAKGNWRDDLWISIPASIPEIGTPVTLIITPTQP